MNQRVKRVIQALTLCTLMSCGSSNPASYQTESMLVEIDPTGTISRIEDLTRSVSVMDTTLASPLLQIQRRGKLFTASKMRRSGDYLLFDFSQAHAKVKVKAEVKDAHLVFEVVEIDSDDRIEKVQWGPIHSNLTEKVGMSLGVVYDTSYALGLMGLNLKSCGGFEGFARERFGNTAQCKGDYSVLQGFTRDRSYVRQENTCLQELVEVLPLTDGDASIIGSKFALYGVSTQELNNTIKKIEKEEGLPFLTHDGEWLKETLYATSSKFIMGYNISNIDKCLEIATHAGITCVYHPGIFQSWGTFGVRKNDFPQGYSSVRECQQKAKEKGITLGAHTLSNFIQGHDPMVTPVPESGLQLAGMTTLKTSIDKTSEEILLADTHVYVAYAKDNLEELKQQGIASENKNRETFALRIGDELIQYSQANKTDDGVLLTGCKRGAYGTHPSNHSKGSKAGRLVSHYYHVFFPDIQLQDKMAKNLANFFNETGLERISFDGIEGGLAAGHGRYGSDRFIKVFFDHLENKNIIANSSDVMHYSWHYFANESWGEPWWAKNFRESQLDHRIRVQQLLEEDLLPRKLGQFSITKQTSLNDIEWVMGLCLGYDAGIDFYIAADFLDQHPQAKELLSIIKKYEEIRWQQKLTHKQKSQLRDPLASYKVKELENGNIDLVFLETWAPEGGKLQSDHGRSTLPKNTFTNRKHSSISLDYMHVNMQKEPGQPTFAEWDYYNIGKEQALNFTIRLPKSRETIEGLYFKMGAHQYAIPFALKEGEYIICEEGQITHYGVNKKIKNKEAFITPTVERGKNQILFDYQGKGRVAGPEVIVNFMIQKN